MSGAFSYFDQSAMPAPTPVPQSNPLAALAPSPLAPAGERAALQSLLDVLTEGTSQAAGTPTGGKYGGQPGTGNLATDARDAYNAGMFGFGMNLANNPASMLTSVPATMLNMAIRAAANLPEPTSIRSGFGLRGLATTIGDLFGNRAAQHAAALKGVDMANRGGAVGQGGGKDKPDAAPPGYAGWGNDEQGGAKTGGGGGKGDFGADAAAESSPGSEEGGMKAGGGLVKPSDGRVIPLAGGGKIALGPGGGLDDLIPTTINGRRSAALSDGEFVIPADVVSMFGDGSSNAGARRLYDLVRQVRENKTGTNQQAGPLPIGDILKRALR